MVRQYPSTESDLLHPVIYGHAQDAFGTGLYVVYHHHLLLHIPHLQIVSACCEQEVLFVEKTVAYRHRLVLSLPDHWKGRIYPNDPADSIRAAYSHQASSIRVYAQDWRGELVLENWFLHPDVPSLHDAILTARNDYFWVWSHVEGCDFLAVVPESVDCIFGPEVPYFSVCVHGAADDQIWVLLVGIEGWYLDRVPFQAKRYYLRA